MRKRIAGSWQYILEGLGILLLMWCFYPLLNYNNLPETIPTHFNFAGEADNWGSRTSILTLPIIAIVTYVGLTILQRFPKIYNYPTKITDENRTKAYDAGIGVVRYIKVFSTFIFAYGTNETYAIAINGSDHFGIGSFFLPMVFIGFTWIIIAFCMKISRLKNQ